MLHSVVCPASGGKDGGKREAHQRILGGRGGAKAQGYARGLQEEITHGDRDPLCVDFGGMDKSPSYTGYQLYETGGMQLVDMVIKQNFKQ